MNKLNNIFILLLLCLAFSACDEFENSAESSTTTFLPVIELEAESVIDLACGTTSFTTPTGTAVEAGQEIPLNVSINGVYFGSDMVDGPDKYIYTFSALNEDEIPGAETVTVFNPPCNGDLVNSIVGSYTAFLSRTTVGSGAVVATPQYQGVGPIFIKDLGNNMYQLSDGVGGWYEYGRSLGVPYVAIGQTFTANDISANDFTFGDAIGVGLFGGANALTGINVDPATKTIVINTDWVVGSSNFTFEIRLVQNPQ